MRDFYVYFVDADNHIVGRTAIKTSSVSQAVECGFDALRHWNTVADTRRAVAIEIWNGTKRVFAGRPDRGADRYIANQQHWLNRAEEARVLAEQLSDVSAKQTLWQIARGYQSMAERAEQFGMLRSRPR